LLFDADHYGEQQVRNTRPCSVVDDYLLDCNTLRWAHSSLWEVIPCIWVPRYFLGL